MKKEHLIFAGIMGAAIGFVVGTNTTIRKYKDVINKEVKEAVNKEIRNDIVNKIDSDKIEKAVIDKIANDMGDKTDKKLKEFNERLEVMEDIDAKKLDLAKAAITAGATICTVLIKAIYDNKNNDIKMEKYIDVLGEKHNELVNTCLENFAEAEKRFNALEVK